MKIRLYILSFSKDRSMFPAHIPEPVYVCMCVHTWWIWFEQNVSCADCKISNAHANYVTPFRLIIWNAYIMLVYCLDILNFERKTLLRKVSFWPLCEMCFCVSGNDSHSWWELIIWFLKWPASGQQLAIARLTDMLMRLWKHYSWLLIIKTH